jgi:hypothetical protein
MSPSTRGRARLARRATGVVHATLVKVPALRMGTALTPLSAAISPAGGLVQPARSMVNALRAARAARDSARAAAARRARLPRLVEPAVHVARAVRATTALLAPVVYPASQQLAKIVRSPAARELHAPQIATVLPVSFVREDSVAKVVRQIPTQPIVLKFSVKMVFETPARATSTAGAAVIPAKKVQNARRTPTAARG